jgi:uncharacterized NAD(P)/FAD-binding protein YdhS
VIVCLSIQLYAIGPLLKGVLWETTAMPEIRRQAALIAQDLLAGLGDAQAPGLRRRFLAAGGA